MAQQIVNAEMAEIALARVEGTRFERFFQTFFPGLMGIDFIPLGGTKDGGADAFTDVDAYEGKKAGAFYQASIEEDHRSKIRRTVKRLKQFGRQPQQLTYATNQVIPHIDVEEETLSDELGLTIRIRDRKFIISNLNSNSLTIAAFNTHLLPLLTFLFKPGNVPIIPPSENVVSPAVYVFLRQEVERRSGNSSLLHAITDSLILWALEGTDPDKGLFLTKAAIEEKILSAIPTAQHFIKRNLEARLEKLSEKQNPTGREIRFYKKEGKFCLPYETRLLAEAENVEDESLRIKVIERFHERITAMKDSGLTPDLELKTAQLALRTVQVTFEMEGLEFASFLHEGEAKHTYESIADIADKVLGESGMGGGPAISIKAALCACLREAFYASSEEERIYFSKLSRTYSLMFSLKVEPRLVDYFQTMVADFYLYVGTDILVRALSERYLKKEDQITRNLLSMIVQAGAHLVLAEPVLEEVCGHLEVTDWEFLNHFAEQESCIDAHIARHASKILIRAYFYAKLSPEKHSSAPKSWQQFVGQFCTYSNLHKPSSREEIKNYMLSQFRMKFESAGELSALVVSEEVQKLAERLNEIKSDRKLAQNDATMVLAVYGRRNALKESSTVSHFGYRTWWLTGESRILGYTRDVVGRYAGAWYLMRPEFILNFIALSPTTAQVRQAYKSIFPTILGIRLAGRMREDVFHDLMAKVKEANSLEDGRRKALSADLSNHLKGDFYKDYEKQLQQEAETRQRH